jgi:hypothetical protein
MTLGTHLIEDDTCKAEGREILTGKACESVNDGSCAVGHAPGIDNEQDGKVKDGCHFRRRTFPTVVTVIKPHHSLHNVHLFMIMIKYFT